MGIRVIKTALAALAAIYTASTLGLDPELAAGLLAILGVEVTRKRGLQSAFVRFVASVLGLFFASVLFAALGFHIWVISLFILVAFPVMSRLALKDGITTSAVIVFHVYAKAEVTAAIIVNEVLLLLVGLGWATVVNMLYMPREDRNLAALRHRTEALFSGIFNQMARTLRDPSHVWDGAELLEAGAAIEEGIRRADLALENRVPGQDAAELRYWRTYFEMRRLQLESVSDMLVCVSLVYEKLPQGELAAEVFDLLADEVKSDVYEGIVERHLSELGGRFKQMALPASRDEFEIRAAILELTHELNRYLAIAKRWKKHKAARMTADPA
ncbi:aromatic acid exporter family protein [Paenibacillus aurantiacus]|uniref:Aromatic acid exporter family protein n=1 Tax=Paenibacillus aurantiacus TaxID=1936118 RepID=A0ABV5L1B4_9BACL